MAVAMAVKAVEVGPLGCKQCLTRIPQSVCDRLNEDITLRRICSGWILQLSQESAASVLIHSTNSEGLFSGPGHNNGRSPLLVSAEECSESFRRSQLRGMIF